MNDVLLEKVFSCGCFLLFVTFTLFIQLAQADNEIHEKDPITHHSFGWENDAIADDDGGYTNGFVYSWGRLVDQHKRPTWMDKTSQWLPFPDIVNHQEAVSYQVAQAIFTPSDIKTEALIDDDRPYAGLLLASLNHYRFNEKTAIHYEFILGAVGPISGAEQLQRFIHELIDANIPQGWDNQLENELVFRVGYEQLWRLHDLKLGKNLEYDLLMAGDIKGGNLSSDLGAGISIRLGKGLANSFPMAWLTPGRGLASLSGTEKGQWNIFATLYGNYVFNDITIDGNTFENSHSVELIHSQGRYVIGANYFFQNWSVSFSVQESTDSFEDSQEDTFFSTVSFSIYL